MRSSAWLRRSTRRVAVASVMLWLACGMAGAQTAPAAAQQSDEFVSHTKVGDAMPPISVEQAGGGRFSLAAEKGKVVLINFWATWCPPCQAEMPRLEKDIWEKYKTNPEFVMIGIAREQDAKDVLPFLKQHPEYTYPFAWDPDRAAYKQLADAGIPRCYVVDRNGVIVLQSVGYEPKDVGELSRAIDKALAAK